MQVLEIRDAELIESLTEQAAERGITDAAIVTLISRRPAAGQAIGGGSPCALAASAELGCGREGCRRWHSRRRRGAPAIP